MGEKTEKTLKTKISTTALNAARNENPGKPFLRMKIKTFRLTKLLTSGGANSE
jgi:hypothetical protein